MMRIALVFVAVFLFFPFCAIGQDAAQKPAEKAENAAPQIHGAAYYLDALKLAASIDAYAAYCDKKSDLAGALAERFSHYDEIKDADLDLRQQAVLDFEDVRLYLSDAKPKCKDQEFLLHKYALMKKLEGILQDIAGVKLDDKPDEQPAIAHKGK